MKLPKKKRREIYIKAAEWLFNIKDEDESGIYPSAKVALWLCSDVDYHLILVEFPDLDLFDLERRTTYNLSLGNELKITALLLAAEMCK